MTRYEKQLEQIVTASEAYLTRWRDRVRQTDLGTAAFVAVHTVDAATHAGITRASALDDETLTAHVSDLVLSYLVDRPHGSTRDRPTR